MKSDIETTNKRLGKLETAVLALFGVSLAAWVLNKFMNLDWLLTIFMAALFFASLALFALVIKALVQRKASKAKKKK